MLNFANIEEMFHRKRGINKFNLLEDNQKIEH